MSKEQERKTPTNLQAEPAYPGKDTVLMSMRDPEVTAHLASPECAIEEPHKMTECGKWKPTNPSHGELLDELIRTVAAMGGKKMVSDKADDLRSLILGKMGEGEKYGKLLDGIEAVLNELGVPKMNPDDPQAFLSWRGRIRLLVATASRLQSELEEARNEIGTCDDVRLDQPLATSIADLQRARAAAEARLAAQPDMEKLLDNLCVTPDKTWCQRGREELRQILAAHLAPQVGVPNDQKTYDPIAELEYIAKEITGEDVALEDLSGQLDFAIQVLKERVAPASHTPRCPKCGDDGKGLGRALVVGLSSVKCWACGARFEIKSISDFAQFFPVTSSQGGAE